VRLFSTTIILGTSPCSFVGGFDTTTSLTSPTRSRARCLLNRRQALLYESEFARHGHRGVLLFVPTRPRVADHHLKNCDDAVPLVHVGRSGCGWPTDGHSTSQRFDNPDDIVHRICPQTATLASGLRVHRCIAPKLWLALLQDECCPFRARSLKDLPARVWRLRPLRGHLHDQRYQQPSRDSFSPAPAKDAPSAGVIAEGEAKLYAGSTATLRRDRECRSTSTQRFPRCNTLVRVGAQPQIFLLREEDGHAYVPSPMSRRQEEVVRKAVATCPEGAIVSTG